MNSETQYQPVLDLFETKERIFAKLFCCLQHIDIDFQGYVYIILR